MRNNRSVLLISAITIILLAMIPAVSAENIRYFSHNDLPLSVTYEHKSAVIYTKSDPDLRFVNAGTTRTGDLGLVLKAVENYPELNYVYLEHRYKMSEQDAKKCYQEIPTGEFIGTYTRPSDNSIQPITVYVDRYYNILGQETGIRILAFPQNWAIGTKTGLFYSPITFNGTTYSFVKTRPHYVYVHGGQVSLSTPLSGGIVFKGGPGAEVSYCIGFIGSADIGVVGFNHAKNIVNIADINGLIKVSAVRQFDGNSHTSEIGVYNKDNDLITFNNDPYDVVLGRFNPDIFGKVTIKVPSLPEFNHTLIYDSTITDPGDPGDPGDPTSLTVYIKNSQTGALIVNANIVIDALVNGEYYPVVNRSEPSGIFTINLQPTGGGPPNPDGYRLIVTADGYNNPMPEINFTVDDYKQSIYCLLDPIAGGPADENKTFIDFFVSDMYANPVPGATVKFGKYTLITNSAGYTVFEVPKNDYYTYTVSKSGYNTITGNVNIGDAPRNTVNTYLTPVITPPTQPTGWPTDPPTQPTGGIPDEDDDSDGFLMESVRGIANLFGVSFGVGKTILGMLLALSIGTATAKHLRGGAQEFGMGMLGGVVLGVLIGLLPIWVLVLLVLIVGLWIGQRYMSGGDS